MLLKKRRLTSRILSILLVICLMMSGFSVGQLFVSAAEITGYQREAVVRFRNAGSGKYLNVHNGQNANEVNVYQWTADNSTEQKFKLRYNFGEDCYMIGTMCSSNGNGRVLDIVKSGGQVKAGCNVEIYNAVDPVAQQWQFSYYEDGMFVIFPMANQYLALTANGNSNGSSGGQSATSAGNVYLSAIPMSSTPEYSLYQLWFIEEVEPQQTILNGEYRITNLNGKRITVNAEDMNGVYQMSNPRNMSYLDEAERAYLQQQQLWRIEYLYSGYYMIKLAVDETVRLSVVGNYQSLGASVCAIVDTSTTDSWHYRIQWKILPNATDGSHTDSFRIVSKGEYNTQTMTVLHGSNADGASIAMVPYDNASSQQWVFEDNSCAASEAIGDHVLDFNSTLNTSHYYCIACNRLFETPQSQDFDANNLMSREPLTLILALEHMATLKAIEGEKLNFAEACYRAADLIRANYGRTGWYDCKGTDGKYVSPVNYSYNADTVNASVQFELRVYGEQYAADRGASWKIGQMLPAPFNRFSEAMWLLMDPLCDYNYASLLATCGIGLAEWAIPELFVPEDVRKVLSAVSFASSLNALYDERSFVYTDFIEVTIYVYDEDRVDRFIGYYDLTANNQMVIIREDHMVQERTIPLESAPENLFEGVFSFETGNGGIQEIYVDEELFS